MNGSSTLYYYSLFGLVLTSEREFAELIAIEETPDVDVHVVFETLKLPESMADQGDKIVQQIKQNFYFLQLNDYAYFKVEHEDNTTISIDVLNEDQYSIIKSWLFGSVFTVVLQMNNRFAFHASAVKVGEEVVLFCGRSGVGKSTIATRLNNHGFDIVTDDKSVLTVDPNVADVYLEPSIQITRLWNDSLLKLGDDSFLEKPESVTLKEDKFQFLIKEENRIREPSKVKAIYIMFEVLEDVEMQIRRLNGSLKFKRLRNQIHRPGFVQKLKKRKECWDYLEHISQRLPVATILRPKGTKHEAFTAFVLKEISA